MRIEPKFSDRDLLLIEKALNLGAVHTQYAIESEDMVDLSKKIRVVNNLNKIPEKK